jgi:NADH-quinone oxidoreductase subunit L
MIYAAVFLPLLGAFLAGRFGTKLGNVIGEKNAMFVTTAFVCISAILSVFIFIDVALGHHEYVLPVFDWIHSGSFQVAWALKIDTLTAVMLVVVNVISAMVHIYSIGYMSHDPHKARFFAYLSLFTFMMLMLVTANNLLQLFFGWEGVGLMSYLLINFWYQKDSANQASIKAFIVNRIGDVGFSLGIMTIFVLFGSINFDVIFNSAAEHPDMVFNFLGFECHALTVACLLLFCGAVAKSAQLGLHTWLPDAMEGPTPVSALIHAATMVTAGVFLVARMSPLFEFSPIALATVTIFGAVTAFVAATIGIVQNDIKRVVAYSTMSQLGYMFFALGVSAYSAAIFHLMTHAFFKALLFLSAGSVIHAMSDEQDMRKMGGLWKKIPVTYAMMWIGSLALAGLPFFAGYFSKDMIIEAAFAAGTTVGKFAFVMGVLAAALTGYYSWRLIVMTFHGQSHADDKTLAHVHESPLVMLFPLGVLALGAVFAGYFGYDWFVGDDRLAFWGNALFVRPDNDPISNAHHLEFGIKVMPLIAGVVGIALAYYFFMFNRAQVDALKIRFAAVHAFLSDAWRFNALYDFLFVKPMFKIGAFFWKRGDEQTIDRFGPNGVALFSKMVAERFSFLQTGYIYHYAFVMVIGLVLFSLWFGM